MLALSCCAESGIVDTQRLRATDRAASLNVLDLDMHSSFAQSENPEHELRGARSRSRCTEIAIPSIAEPHPKMQVETFGRRVRCISTHSLERSEAVSVVGSSSTS